MKVRCVRNEVRIEKFNKILLTFLNFLRRLLFSLLSTFFLAVSCMNVDLLCDFGTPKCDPQLQACYYCNVKNMNVLEKNVEVSSLKEIFNGDSVNDTQILTILKQIVYYLPRKFPIFVPKTQILKIIASGLKAITLDDLQDFHYLREIHMTNNDIEILPSNLLQISSDVNVIDFSGNKIKHVGFNFFDNKNIYLAKFHHNLCVNIGSDLLEPDSVKTVENELQISCQPTHQMIIDQINWLRHERQNLIERLRKCRR